MSSTLKSESGMGWVDAPISGTPVACREGKLTVMAGGSDEDFNLARPVIEQLAGRLTHMGPSGAGQTTKLVNQALVGGTLTLVAEAIKFAQDAGVDARQIPVALTGGRADSPVLQEWGTRMTVEDYEATATIDILVKDLNTVARTAQPLGTPMPVVSAASNIFQLASRMGFGQLDVCAIKKVYDKPEEPSK
jgi:3-hydroxyisobutyrate dehydrogenase-like beta-hydroxyacid dehydrogenase